MVADLTRKVIGVHENQLHPELFHHDIGMRGTILVVADGLGGHEGGEIASRLAVDIVAQALVDAAEPALPMSEQIMRAVDMAHEAICTASRCQWADAPYGVDADGGACGAWRS